MKLRIERSVVVITPTIGKPALAKAIESVQNQTYGNIQHLIAIDGTEYFQNVWTNVSTNNNPKMIFNILPWNTGGNGFYGHRIYAAFPHLVDHDYILFLDEDNWYEPNHVKTLVNKIEDDNLDWAHSLRKVYVNNEFLADDNCESIGRWPIAWSDGTQHLVDTSSYCFKKDMLIKCCHIWHSGWGGDRRFFMEIKNHWTYDTTGIHSLNYNLPDMNKAYGGDLEIFAKYNEVTKQKYGGKYPWRND